jgi:hypothetical protein
MHYRGVVEEWNESILHGASRGLRGGSFSTGEGYLLATYRDVLIDPTDESYHFGSRVAEAPELASPTSLASCGVGVLMRRRARRGRPWPSGDVEKSDSAKRGAESSAGGSDAAIASA